MVVAKWIRRTALDASPEAQRIRSTIKILILIALFAGLFWIIPLQEVVQAILTADPLYLLLGLAAGTLSTVLTAFEMEPLTRQAGIQHRVGTILNINLAVKFYTQFMPTSLVASGLRWYRLAQPGGKTAEALAALAFFRMLETFLTFALGLGFWLASSQDNTQVGMAWLLGLIGLTVAGWLVITRLSLPLYRIFKARLGERQEHRLLKPLLRRMDKFLSAVSAYASIPAGDLLAAVFWGTVSSMASIVSGLWFAQAVGIQITFLELGWIQAVVLLATQLPFAVAGGLGIREVTLVAAMGAYGVSAEQALALSFLMFVRGILIALLGGVTEAVDAIRQRRSRDQSKE
ncbi:MAG: lysylphosphatidylglycerol synthase transmembrane domain-containing protein [Chloroflexota bacterium]